MASLLANPDRLFDRTWRPRHPLRPRLSAARRWGMPLLFLFFCTVIFGYGWLTDSNRVRRMASAYLSELLGGDVEIGRADLSIFEGLRLDNVVLRVDGGKGPDSVLFTAQTFFIRYNPGELLAGRLQATQILAINPKVTLVEDPQTHRWNYQRMIRGNAASRPASGAPASPPLILPEIILRDAQVAYLEIRQGKIQPLGWVDLEGHLSPGTDTNQPDRYDFELQSRGRQALGPSVSGMVRTSTGQFSARLRNFTFGPDIKTMLPAEVRTWWETHDLQGRVDIPELYYVPAPRGGKPTFHVETTLGGVELAVRPREWMSREQNKNVQWFHDVLTTAQSNGWLGPDTVQTLRKLSTPEPIHLQEVSGTFVFTEKGIEVKGVNGRLENNWFDVKGSIAGYSPDAAASVTISSLPSHRLYIPPWSPTYAGSMPPEVQEIYEKLRPHGWCSMWVKIDRPEAGARPSVAGEVDIHDGEFSFSELPYPLRNATGKIVVGHDSLANMDGIRIANVRGLGREGGPNANSVVAVDGFIGPLDQVAGVWLDVRGENLSNEPALRAAMPAPVDRVLRMFDPGGLGDYPTFHGNFTSHITRPIGPHKRWSVQTDIDLDHISGSLSVFPYPLRNMSARLEVRDGYVDLIDAHVKRGDGTLSIGGRIKWKTSLSKPTDAPFGPNLKIVGRNLPIDSDLIQALPDAPRICVQKAGTDGTLDVDGHLFPILAAKPGQREIDYAFDVSVHNASLWPLAGTFAVSGAEGKLHLTPDQMVLTGFTGKHGSGDLQADGTVDWTGPSAKVLLTASAQNMPMDASLYHLLPESARQAWDSVAPDGTIDASLKVESQLPRSGDLTAAVDRFALKIKPRALTITPGPLPYRLEKLSGLITITPDDVVLDNISAHHGDTAVTLSGEGKLGAHPTWDIKLAAKELSVDDELIRAVPESVAGILKSLGTTGKIGIEFSKLAYRPSPEASATTRPGAKPGTAPRPDIDFAAKVTFNGASMDVGLPLQDVFGTMDLAGLVRDGKLYRMAGQVNAEKLTMAGRPASNMKVTLNKPVDESLLQMQHLEGSFAGGDIAGDGQLTYPEQGQSRYDLSLVLRDADVQTLTRAPPAKKIDGRLTASLTMSGIWTDPNSRRGHGDVRVSGEDMYDIPVVLGLLQVTNLALPLSTPFSEATTRYSLDGQKVTLERIDLRSKDMTMSGSGRLDFGTRKVSLEFVTDNPALVSIPIVGPLIHTAKQELLKIHVNGSIQEPKVSATTFDTITTTVDEVFRGDEKK